MIPNNYPIQLWSSPESPPYGFSRNYQCVNTLKCSNIWFTAVSKYCYHSSVSWLTTPSIFGSLLNIPCFPYLSHYPFILLHLYSPPSVCSDKMVFHAHLRDKDLIRGNQGPASEKMNGMQIMQRNWRANEFHFHPCTKRGWIYLMFSQSTQINLHYIKKLTGFFFFLSLTLSFMRHTPWLSGTLGSFHLSKCRWLNLQKWWPHQRHLQPPGNGTVRPWRIPNHRHPKLAAFGEPQKSLLTYSICKSHCL